MDQKTPQREETADARGLRLTGGGSSRATRKMDATHENEDDLVR